MEKTALPTGNQQVDIAHFQEIVRKMLHLPTKADAREIRRALESRGERFVTWYDNCVREYERSPSWRASPPLGASAPDRIGAA